MTDQATETEKERRIREQIRQYAHVENMHAQLADIFAYWQETWLKPRFRSLYGAKNHLEFYAGPFADSIRKSGCNRIASIGCGGAQVEIGIAGVLAKAKVEFRFDCIELSPMQIDRARKNADEAGLGRYFEFTQADFNEWECEPHSLAGVMAHHALHHVVELEQLAGTIRNGLVAEGAFASMDLIGRNGHMRWPEALEIIERIWAFLPEEKKYHHILKVLDERYVNRDCSTQGFEGIRSQDILPILIRNFSFETFFAFGNLIDVFTSRGYGANWDPANAKDRAFIDYIDHLNETLVDLGHIKPTRMFAVMTPGPGNSTPRVYKNWTPEFCVRPPGP